MFKGAKLLNFPSGQSSLVASIVYIGIYPIKKEKREKKRYGVGSIKYFCYSQSTNSSINFISILGTQATDALEGYCSKIRFEYFVQEVVWRYAV